MTRDEFIAKIENPDDVNRVMARVDEGAQLMGKTSVEELEKWYDECAGYYDAAHEDVITKYEEVGVKFNPMYGEEREVLKPVDKAKWFSFLHFNAMMSEALDKYRCLKYFTSIEDEQMFDAEQGRASIEAHVRDHVMKSGGLFSGEDFEADVVEVLYQHYERYHQLLEIRIDDLNDAIALIELKEYLNKPGCQTTEILFTTTSLNLSKFKIKGTRANKLMSDVLVPYFIDRFSSKYFSGKDLDELKAELKMCKKLNGRILHKAVFELYKVFDKYGYFEYSLPKDTYHLGEKDGKYGRVTFDISVWIYDLFALIDDSEKFNDAEYDTRKEKADKIRNMMEMDTRDLEMDLPKGWELFLF